VSDKHCLIKLDDFHHLLWNDLEMLRQHDILNLLLESPVVMFWNFHAGKQILQYCLDIKDDTYQLLLLLLLLLLLRTISFGFGLTSLIFQSKFRLGRLPKGEWNL